MDEHQTEYLDIVGAAYDASAEPDRFDDLLDVASSFFFKRTNSDEDVAASLDPALERRSLQMARMLEEDLTEKKQNDPEPFHAQLEIDPSTLTVIGNSAAQHLTGCVFPCRFDELPFDHTTRSLFRQNFFSSQQAGAGDKIILATIEQPTVRSCLALVQRPANASGKVILSMSFIEWSDELVVRLKDAFGLTQSEAEVLTGHLRHRTRKEIAEQRGTTEETVKAQAKSILRKTGSNRMTDVVQLSASIAYLLRTYPKSGPRADLDHWHTPQEHMHVLERGGDRKLAYYKYGTGSKHILFVHAFFQGPFFSQAFLDVLARNDISLYCPSRPSFGYSSASPERGTHDQQTVDDALMLVRTERLDDITIVTHQGGVSHAFRIAAALGSKARNMVMIDAGIPIDEERHLKKMDPLTRLAGAASKHAPSIMAMMMNLGIPVYKKRGIRAFLKNYLKESPVDLATLEDPEALALCAFGCFHNSQQGSEAFVRDGASAMANWQADFDAVKCPQLWIHPDKCPVMHLEFVQEFIANNPGPKLQVIENAGVNVLYQYPEQIAQAICDFRETQSHSPAG